MEKETKLNPKLLSRFREQFNQGEFGYLLTVSIANKQMTENSKSGQKTTLLKRPYGRVAGVTGF